MHRGRAAVLEIRDLAIEIAGMRPVDGVSLEVRPGELVALVGESGCGKSLTALACVRLLPRGARVAGGDIHVQGRSILRLAPRDLRAVRGKEIGFTFQEPMTALHPTIRCGEQVAEAILAHERVRPRAARVRAAALLERVGIPDPARRYRSYPHELSGGQRQRIGIAIALAASPALLVADEPTTALDPSLRREIIEFFARERRERGLGVLLITHDLGLAGGFADEVAVMYAGRIVERAPAAALFAGPLHPYARGLLRAIPWIDERRARLEAIPGAVPAPHERPGGCRFRTRCALAGAECAGREPALERKNGAAERYAACLKT